MSSRSRKSIANILSARGCDHAKASMCRLCRSASFLDAASGADKVILTVITGPVGEPLFPDVLAACLFTRSLQQQLEALDAAPRQAQFRRQPPNP